MMAENAPIKDKEKEFPEVVKSEINYTYNLGLAGHSESDYVGESYCLVYESGLQIILARLNGRGKWGHWNYNPETGKKDWAEVEIPENPRVAVHDNNGVFLEMMLLADRWRDTHDDTYGDDFREYLKQGVNDFLEKTGQSR
jgi:hypothetical protein